MATPELTTTMSSKSSPSALHSSSSSSSSGITISRDELLSTLIHAATHGAQTVSSLSDVARNGNIQFKEEGDARSALTVADTSAQRVIVSSILGVYPTLNIVGEEDESVVEVDVDSQRELRNDLLNGYEWTTTTTTTTTSTSTTPLQLNEQEIPSEELDMNDLVVYVDPLDGTREFVEGRLDNVQSLIGVTFKGTPIMGAVGLPFPTDSKDNSTEVYFGLVGKGIGKLCTKKGTSDIVKCPMPTTSKTYSKGETINVSSGDSASVQPVVDLAESLFASNKGGVARQVLGATGNKLLKVVHGETTLSLLHDKTSLWDTAAPTAMLTAMGGKVTDYYGDALVYDKDVGLRNKLGVVASAAGAGDEHDEMTKALRDGKATLSFLQDFC